MAYKKYQIENADKEKARHKRYYESHQEQIKQYRESRKDITKEYMKTYQKENRERLNEKSKEWVSKNKKKRAEIVKRYNDSHATGKRQLAHYCCEDISHIENYELAIKDNLVDWDIHHRLETRGFGYTSEELKMLDLYYNRPASELLFVRCKDHYKIHKDFRRKQRES